MPETPLADQAKPFHSDRVDIVEPNAFELVEMQRTKRMVLRKLSTKKSVTIP